LKYFSLGVTLAWVLPVDGKPIRSNVALRLKPKIQNLQPNLVKFPPDRQTTTTHIGLGKLWREFIPLSLSDVTMAAGDPLLTATLAHLPDARSNLAAVGIGRTVAIFFESPIIMLLHASNAVAADRRSRQVLWQFMLLAGGSLSLGLGLLALPVIFDRVGERYLGIPTALAGTVWQVILLLILWPLAIAWRRYFQGLLIYHGNSRSIARASIARLVAMGMILAIGVAMNGSGAILAGTALIGGVLVEACWITIVAYRSGATVPPPLSATVTLPQTLRQMWRFYRPLATSMLVTWGGRAILVGLVARSIDAPIALAAWPAASGLVLIISNSTRMVQQIIIKYQSQVSTRLLLKFALSVGGGCSALLLSIGTTTVGDAIVRGFIGNDRILATNIKPVLTIFTAMPLLVAIQNAMQGFLVGAGKTSNVNRATGIGTSVLVAIAWLTVNAGWSGAVAAATATVIALAIEVFWLILTMHDLDGDRDRSNPQSGD
jgi:progressive ankylosis protein